MADGDPIFRAYLEINGTQVVCESVDFDPDDKTEWVEAMTRDNEPLGVIFGNRKFEIKVEAPMLEGETDNIDYLELWEKKTNIPTSIEYQGGITISFGKGVISKPSAKSKHGDKTTWSLELKCWQMSST